MLQTRQVGVVDCEVPDELSGLGVVLLESGSTETVNELRVGDGVLGIIEIAYRVSIISPVRPPESDRDVIPCLGGFLELGQHRRRRRGLEGNVRQPVHRQRLMSDGLRHLGTRFNAVNDVPVSATSFLEIGDGMCR